MGLHETNPARVRFTSEGGLAIRMIAGENLVAGEVVHSPEYPSGADDSAYKTPISGDSSFMPYGVVYANASSGDPVWIVVSGKALVLPESGITAARGDVIFVSGSESGRVDQSATVPTTDHWKECGHGVSQGTGNGVAALAIVHFN